MPRFGDPEFDAVAAVLCKSSTDQSPQLVLRKAVHAHDRFGAACGIAAREQQQSPAFMRLRRAKARRGHGGYHLHGPSIIPSDTNTGTGGAGPIGPYEK